MTEVAFSGAKKRYGKTHALDGLTMNLAGNKIIGILGRNGAGKTTALNLLAGHLKTNGGTVTVSGHHPFNSLYVSANTILIEEGMTFPPSFTLSGILDEMGRAYRSFDRKLAANLLDHFGIPLNAFHIQLSKGMKNTFNMVVGLSARMPLTMFDEPLNGMDAAVRSDLLRILLREFIAHPRMILLSGHQLEELENLFEEVAILHEGRLLHHGRADEFKEQFVRISGTAQEVREAIDQIAALEFHETLPGMAEAILRIPEGATLFANKHNGLHTSPVSLNDAYIAMTRKKGAIDHVYTDATDGS